MLGGELHKKKKKHSDDYYHRGEKFVYFLIIVSVSWLVIMKLTVHWFFTMLDHEGSGPAPHKKKHKSADRSSHMSPPPSSHSTDTAMGLLQAITSPLATGSDPGPHFLKKPSYPSFSSHSSKDRKREHSSGGGSKGSHSFCQSRPTSSTSSKKHSSASSKSSLFHGGTSKEEPLTLREADGLKMKLIMSPEKEESESFPITAHSSKGVTKKDKDRDKMTSKTPKRKLQQSQDPLPVVGKEVEVEGERGAGVKHDRSPTGRTKNLLCHEVSSVLERCVHHVTTTLMTSWLSMIPLNVSLL